MANLAQSGVTILRAWCEGGVTGKERSCRQVSLVLVTQGSVANNIPASVLGLTGIIESSTFVKSDNSLTFPTCPSADGSLLLVTGLNNVPANAPVDTTATIIGVVKGYVA